jgi:hypothetical protein
MIRIATINIVCLAVDKILSTTVTDAKGEEEEEKEEVLNSCLI